MDELNHRPPPLGWGKTVLLFGGAGVLLYAGTHLVIPWLSTASGLEAVVCWFLVGGLGVFLPLVILGLLFLWGEARAGRIPEMRSRLWLRPMNKGDWWWTLAALVVIGALSSGIQTGLQVFVPGGADLHPPFMTLEPLSAGRYWILAAWAPFWLLNILGEEFLWRGVMLPRQESAFGAKAWMANAAGWLLFHAAFGWQLMLVLLPIILLLPLVVQWRKNLWVGVVIHAGLNGPGFLAVAFGLV
jgi:membrane protease YdiL (CAAX protease family)